MMIDLIFDSTIIQILDIVYVMVLYANTGVSRFILDYMYENLRWWRRLYWYQKITRKAVMTSCNTIEFYDFENAWEISNKTRYKPKPN